MGLYPRLLLAGYAKRGLAKLGIGCRPIDARLILRAHVVSLPVWRTGVNYVEVRPEKTVDRHGGGVELHAHRLAKVRVALADALVGHPLAEVAVGIAGLGGQNAWNLPKQLLNAPKAAACKMVTAYIPDNPDLYENLTGLQFLNFVADAFDISEQLRRQRINEYADRLGISDALGDLIGSYSHGMKQKVAIISALIHEPKLLVLDEPFVGLDPEAAFTLKEIMHELCARGSAVFFSTHVLDVAERLCNKIAIIKQGSIIASGTIDELLEDGQSLEDVFLEVVRDER